VGTEVFVARQPILNSNLDLFAYELLFRSNIENYFDLADGDQATVDVINNSFFLIGFNRLTGGTRACINFTENLLVEQIASSFPRDQIIVEILENVQPSDQVLSACHQLRKAGYTVALDDFVMEDLDNPLIDCVDIIKVDFENTVAAERREIPQLLKKDVTFLAEKVETMEDFRQADKWGYSLFQGYFFSKPVIKKGYAIPSSKRNYLRILQKVNQDDLDFKELEQIIKQEPSLAYKLLRWINSAYIGLRVQVKSIRQALILLGANEIKKWTSLLAMEKLGDDCPKELICHSVIRGMMCESIAPYLGLKERKSELFLAGMFTVLDALVAVPMEEILEDLPLSSDVASALLGESNPIRQTIDIVLAYEAGDWNLFSERALTAGIDESLIPEFLNDAVEWANFISKEN